MGIMDLIRKMNDRKKAKSEKFKAMEEDYRLQKMLEERQKSSNERELERFMKEEKEAEIKRQLDIIRKQKTKDSWKGTTLKEKYMFKTDRPILKEKNVFVDNKNKVPIQNKRKGMFFRW